MYNGGKNSDGVYQTIINYFPPHTTYYELFGGSGAIIKHKKPAEFNYLYEIDLKVREQFHNHSSYGVGKDAFGLFYRDDLFDASTLCYADPPYIKYSRRSQKDLYRFEWTDEMHWKFLRWAVKTKAMVVISAYQNPLYDKMLKGWRREQYKAGLHNGGTAIESLYMNFPPPNKLHEYTYLGTDCWDRQRIKRRITRKITQLQTMPIYERNAILEALLQYSQK
jgi:DNA adenine methylase